MHAEPTMMFAALRRTASERQNPLEDRCTELLATLIERHDPVAEVVLPRLGVAGLESRRAITAQTQYIIPAGGPAAGQRPDLVIELDGEHRLWVEVKVDAKETGTQVRDYMDELVPAGPSVTLSTLSKDGAGSFPSVAGAALAGGGVHARWSELAGDLLTLAGLGQFVEPSILLDPDVGRLEHDVAQFLVYLNQTGVISMTKPITEVELDLVGRAEWFQPLQSVIDLFKSAASAAALRAGFVDKEWSPTAFSPKWESSGNAWPDDVGQYHLWVWTNRIRKADSAKYNANEPIPTIEITLSDRNYLTDEGPPELGVVWGLYLRTGNFKKIAKDDPAVARAEQVAAAAGEFEPAYEDGGWRFHSIVLMKDVLGAENQQEALTELLAPKLERLRKAIDDHFPSQ